MTLNTLTTIIIVASLGLLLLLAAGGFALWLRRSSRATDVEAGPLSSPRPRRNSSISFCSDPEWACKSYFGVDLGAGVPDEDLHWPWPIPDSVLAGLTVSAWLPPPPPVAFSPAPSSVRVPLAEIPVRHNAPVVCISACGDKTTLPEALAEAAHAKSRAMNRSAVRSPSFGQNLPRPPRATTAPARPSPLARDYQRAVATPRRTVDNAVIGLAL